MSIRNLFNAYNLVQGACVCARVFWPTAFAFLKATMGHLYMAGHICMIGSWEMMCLLGQWCLFVCVLNVYSMLPCDKYTSSSLVRAVAVMSWLATMCVYVFFPRLAALRNVCSITPDSARVRCYSYLALRDPANGVERRMPVFFFKRVRTWDHVRLVLGLECFFRVRRMVNDFAR